MDRIRITTYDCYDNNISRAIREVKLTFEDDDRICNISYEFDTGKYSAREHYQITEIVKKIFASLVMNVEKCLDEFKNKIEEALPNMRENEI